MHKPVCIFFASLLLTVTGRTQDFKIDLQKIEAGRLKPDSNFINYLQQAGENYSNNPAKNDSAEAFFIEAITDAEKIGYTSGLLSARGDLAQIYYLKGKLSPSLNLLLKNEATAVESGDSTALFSTLRVVATIYMKIGDINMLQNSLMRRQVILDNNSIKGLKDTSYYVLSQYNSLALYYSLPQINKLDSCEFFYRKVLTLGKYTSRSNLWAQLGNGGLGVFFSSTKVYDSAVYYYNTAMDAAFQGQRFDNYYSYMNALSKVYQQSGQLDSAFSYAYKVYNRAFDYHYLSLLASSSGILATLYTQQRKYDSAVKYMTFEGKYKDSLSGLEALNSIQVLTSEQQIKDIEKQKEKEDAVKEYKTTLRTYFFIGGLALLLLIIGFMYRVNKQRNQSKKQIENAYHDLKSTQSQLIQSEKMASLGELTAGIAHEIQNPLNFVNNFSEVNQELISELVDEVNKGNTEEVKAIAKDIQDNEEKINHHGKRADAIVKGMLQHSRQTKNIKEPTDINTLCDEYLRLSYHGLRAKNKDFNADFKTEFDESIGKINIVPQDIGRVLLNLFNNAFYAVNEPSNSLKGEQYKPLVSVATKRLNSSSGVGDIEIIVEDNGNGIPQSIIHKIFQPFFTTKPTGQGTGLGLSLSYDIIKAHGGTIIAETKEGEGTTFIINLPTAYT